MNKFLSNVSWGVCCSAILLRSAGPTLAEGPVVRTTPFSRTILRSADAASARSVLGVFATNNWPVTNVSLSSPAITAGTLSNCKVTGGLINNYASPLMFGAIGDGTSDDTAALQASFDYLATNKLGIKTLNLGGRTYRVSATITNDCLGSQIEHGAIVTTNEIVCLVLGNDYESMSYVTVGGPGTNFTAGTCGILVSNAVGPSYIQQPLLRHVVVTNFWRDVAEYAPVEGRINQCALTTAGSNSVFISAANQCAIESSVLGTTGPTPQDTSVAGTGTEASMSNCIAVVSVNSGSQGLMLANNDINECAAGLLSNGSKVTVLNNNFEQMYGDAPVVTLTNGSQGLIQNNFFDQDLFVTNHAQTCIGFYDSYGQQTLIGPNIYKTNQPVDVWWNVGGLTAGEGGMPYVLGAANSTAGTANEILLHTNFGDAGQILTADLGQFERGANSSLASVHYLRGDALNVGGDQSSAYGFNSTNKAKLFAMYMCNYSNENIGFFKVSAWASGAADMDIGSAQNGSQGGPMSLYLDTCQGTGAGAGNQRQWEVDSTGALFPVRPVNFGSTSDLMNLSTSNIQASGSIRGFAIPATPLNAGVVFYASPSGDGNKLINLYPFDSLSGSPSAPFVWTNGPVGMAVFNTNTAASDTFSFADTKGVQVAVSNAFTLLQWVAQPYSSLQAVNFQYEGSGTNILLAETDPLHSRYFLTMTSAAGTTYTVYATNAAAADGAFHQLAWTFNGTTLSAWLDHSTLLAQTNITASVLNTSSFLNVGAGPGGAVGLTAIWARALTTNELNAVFDEGFPP